MPGFLVALIYPQNGDLTKLLKSARKKVPQSARLSAGGGVQKLKGQCPNAPRVNLRGASLKLNSSSSYQLHGSVDWQRDDDGLNNIREGTWGEH